MCRLPEARYPNRPTPIGVTPAPHFPASTQVRYCRYSRLHRAELPKSFFGRCNFRARGFVRLFTELSVSQKSRDLWHPGTTNYFRIRSPPCRAFPEVIPFAHGCAFLLTAPQGLPDAHVTMKCPTPKSKALPSPWLRGRRCLCAAPVPPGAAALLGRV